MEFTLEQVTKKVEEVIKKMNLDLEGLPPFITLGSDNDVEMNLEMISKVQYMILEMQYDGSSTLEEEVEDNS